MWNWFELAAFSSALPMVGATVLSYAPQARRPRPALTIALYALGPIILGLFIAFLWVQLDRPPMRTLGETRLLYSFFLPIIGVLMYLRWGFRWILAYATGMTVLFLLINGLNPENFSKSLMPALVSPWFVPHVVVYIFSYAILAASALVGVRGLWLTYMQPNMRKEAREVLKTGDQLVYIGYGFLTLGLLFGALWAKEAWGHYWTWDPKETWAFITWALYLVYIHYRIQHKANRKQAFWILAVAFVFLMICWVGVNYLPSASTSVHTYTN
jgi:ABC-type transport system involved in cytochrome c biogenesis permease subunit